MGSHEISQLESIVCREEGADTEPCDLSGKSWGSWPSKRLVQCEAEGAHTEQPLPQWSGVSQGDRQQKAARPTLVSAMLGEVASARSCEGT